ncbi:hypothetical protein BJX76DRAFT_354113 [Aspergillus varians]
MDHLKAGKPAAYGESCANCVRSKRKCIVPQAGGPCERCCKTRNECTPAKTVRHRNSKRPPATKLHRLEEKIDSLVPLITAVAQANVTSPAYALATNDIGGLISGGTSQEAAPDPNSDNTSATTPAAFDSTVSLNIGEPTPVEAEECLTHFQTLKLQYFPFVHIPLTTNAMHLRRERPFLWLCIMAVSSRSTAKQQAWSHRIRQIVSQQMVMHSEKSIDLLLGLLTIVGWANYQVHAKPFLSLFTQLAVSLVFDLGLNKPVHDETTVAHCPKSRARRPAIPRSMEERRAVLGCFLMTSVISSFLDKIDTLRWTAHLDECLSVLDEQKECLNDEILIQQVRLQLIAEKATHCDMGRMETWESPSALFSEFAHIKTEILNASPKNAEVISLQLYNVEREVALSTISLTSNTLTPSQHENLYQALTSTRSWFDILLALPLDEYVGFSFAIFSQIIRCIIILFRLATLDASIWDKAHVQKTAKPLATLNQIVNNLERVPILAGLDNRDSPDGDVFSRSAQVLRSLQSEWEARLASDDDMMAPDMTSSSSSQEINGMAFLDAFGEQSFDTDWFIDLLSSTF